MAVTDTVTGLEVHDVRFPTSEQLDGSDAMHPDPDHSAAYVVLSASGGPRGYGSCRTIGRSNDVMAAAVRIAVDANQRWDVAEAVRWMTAPAPYTPYWIEGEDGASPALAESATGHLTAGERAAVFGRTAGRVYGIGA